MKRPAQLLAAAAVVGAVAIGLLAAGTLLGTPAGYQAIDGTASPVAPADPLIRRVQSAQQRLRIAPSDYRTWAALALGYVSLAKATSDPTLYAKADGAVARSLRIDQTHNDVGFAALAAVKNAEHDFRGALAAAQQGLRLNAYSSTLYGALADARTQLGEYAAAAAAVDRMNQLLPGVPAFTRASYVFELRGALGPARAALDRALQDAVDPADRAFARQYLGELSFNDANDPAAALAQYEAGLAVSPDDHALQAARAKALAALGRTDQALAAYRAVVSAVPQPQYVLQLGELLESRHDPEAAQQYALFRKEEDLFRANRVVLDVEPTLFEADHGSPVTALAYAKAGWKARSFLEMADAYAWALYVNHRYSEALGWSHRALATGWPSALALHHRGMIEKALGDRAAARVDLRRALTLNRRFNPLQAPVAAKALAELDR